MKFLFGNKKKREDKKLDKDLVSFLKAYKSKLANEYEQEFSSSLKDQVSGVCSQFKQNLGRSFWKKYQKWSKWGSQGPILQPNNSRLFYRKGETEIMVIEESPQLRTLFFEDGFRYSLKGSYTLSFPYVVFLFVFKHGKFDALYCFFNDRPLDDLDANLYVPFLTNINNFHCCLGTTFKIPDDAKKDYNKIVCYILNYFWSSAHNHHWDKSFISNRQHFQSCDLRLSSLESWETASKQNPLFVVDDVNWLKGGTSLGQTIVNLTKHNKVIRDVEEDIFSVLTEDLLKDILEVSVESLKETTETINQEKDDVNEKKIKKLLKKFKSLEQS